MHKYGATENTPLSINATPETFSSIKEFLIQLANDNPDSGAGLLDFLVPETLIADGAGIRCSYSPEFGKGSVDILRPFAGAIFLLYAGHYDRPDLINQISRKTNLDSRRYMIRMVLEGDISMRFGNDTKKVNRGEALMYRFTEEADVDLVTKAHQHHRYVHMIFTEDGLANASRNLRIEIPSALTDVENSFSCGNAENHNFDERALEHFAESLWLYSGPDHLRAQLLQLKVGELFCLLGEQKQKPASSVGVRLPQVEINKILHARKIVDEEFRSPPNTKTTICGNGSEPA